MRPIRLGFRAFDPHELLCHFLAIDAGLYERPVVLRDITFLADGELDDCALQVSCGSAALAEEPFRIALVASTRPLFWLVARRGTTLADIRHDRIAGYPAFAPPARFLRAVIGAEAAPVRDDDARIGLLLAGEVDASLVSSGSPLPRLAPLGVEPVLFLGDRLQLPTTGLAVLGDPAWLPGLVAAHRAALELVQRDDAAVRATLRRRFRFGRSEAAWFAEVAKATFSADGEPPVDAAALYRDALS